MCDIREIQEIKMIATGEIIQTPYMGHIDNGLHGVGLYGVGHSGFGYKYYDGENMLNEKPRYYDENPERYENHKFDYIVTKTTEKDCGCK